MTKLLDSAGKIVDIPAGQVATAVSSGQFSFPSNRNIPVIQQGEAKWVDPEFAAQYYKRLTFTEDDVVQQQRAQERMRGVGGTLAGLAYGATKAATLGTAPLIAGAVSDTARDYMRDIELGAPTAAGVGEFAGLFVDPFAAFGRRAATRAVGEAGAAALPTTEKFLALPTAAAAQEATATAEGARLLGRPPVQMPAAPVAEAAAPAAEAALPAARAAYSKPSLRSYGQAPLEGEVAATEQAVGEAMVEPVVPRRPLRLGGRLASAEPEAGAGFAARDAALQPRALPPGGSEAAVTPTTIQRGTVDLSGFSPGAEATVPTPKMPLERLLPKEREKALVDAEEALDLADASIRDLSTDAGYDFLGRGHDFGDVRAEVNAVVVPPTRGVRAGGPKKIDPLSVDDIVSSGADPVTVSLNIDESDAVVQAISALDKAVPEAQVRSIKVKTLPGSYTVVWDAAAAEKAWLEAGGKANKANPIPRKPDPEAPFWGLATGIGETQSAKSARTALLDAPLLTKQEMVDEAAVRLRDDLLARYEGVRDRVVTLSEALKGQPELLYPSAEKAGQLSLADISVPAFERVVGEPTAMTGRLEFGRGASEVAAQRAAARQEIQLGQLAAEREAQREAIRRGGLPPERVGPEPVGGLVLAGQPERIGVEEVMAAEDAARAQAAAVSAARQAPPGGAIMPYPTLPSGAADVGLRDAMVAQREAINARALPPRGIGVSDVQAAQRAAAEEVMRGRDMAATAELRGAVEADYAAGRYGVPPERGIVLGERGPLATMPAAGAPPPAGVAPGTLSLGRGAEAAATPEAAAAAIDAARGLSLGPQAAMAAQGAIYGGATEAQRQQLGLSDGGAGAIIASAFGGAAIPLGIMALQSGAGAAGKLIAGAIGSDGLPLGQKIAGAAERMEETALLRMFGMSKANIRELNALFGRTDEDLRGTRKFIDFIKTSFADVERLKQEFPGNATLQSIRTDAFLKFGNLKPEQRVAFAQALKDSTGRAIEEIYKPFYQVEVPAEQVLAAVRRVRQKLIGKGALGDIPIESIRAELSALADYASTGGVHTVGSLRNFENDISRIFRESAGVGKPFTEAQRVFRDEVKGLYTKAIDELSPGAMEALPLMNEAYTMSERLYKGAIDKEATLASQSAVGPDNLNAAVLGAAGLGQIASAVRYLIGAVAVRAFYNQRADGFIADMSQRLGAGAMKMQSSPRAAAEIAARSMIDSSRPVMLGLVSQRFTSATPEEYSALTEAVREMGRDREAIASRLKGAVSNLPPDEQAQVMQKFDRIFQALGNNMPQNLEEPGKVSEQARRYTVFARALLDRAYATQALANGNQDSSIAAEALRAQGEDGQEYIDALEEQLRTSINRDRKLQADQQMLAAYRSIKSHSSRSGLRIGGGRLGATVHGIKMPKPLGGVGGASSVKPISATQVGRAVNAFTGVSGTKF